MLAINPAGPESVGTSTLTCKVPLIDPVSTLFPTVKDKLYPA